MENLIVYLIKSATLLFLFYSTYYFLLKKNTFFTTNRWFLLFGLFCAAFLPLLSFQKIVWVEPAISSVDSSNFEVITTNSMVNLPLPVEENFLISWEMVVGLLYGIGVLIFLTQLLVEFYSLRKIIKSKSKIKVDGFELIEVEEAISPFSFFKKIVYNRNLFQPEELHNIIEHEKIHAKQLHSLDVLIARIYCIFFWWNPVVWFYKNVMVQNLEFIADHNALAKAKDKKSYLLTLLKITTAEKHVAITNHFYQSLIKKRIVMLNTNQSKKHHSWRYFIVLPALVFFMLTYQVEVVAQEREVADIILTKFETLIKSTFTDEDIKEQVDYFRDNFGIIAKFNKISRTKSGEIKSIKIILTHKNGLIKNRYVSYSEPIKPFVIFANEDEKKRVTFGFGKPEDYPTMLQNLEIDKEFARQQKEESKADKSQELIAIPVEDEDDKEKIALFNLTNEESTSILINKSDIKKTENKKKLIVLNGEVISNEALDKIDLNDIQQVALLNANDARKVDRTLLSDENAKKINYGAIFINTVGYKEPKVVQGHYKVDTKPVENSTNSTSEKVDNEENSGWGMSFKTTLPKDNITLIKENKAIEYKKAFISLDGKEISIAEMEKIDPNSIDGISVINGGDNSRLITKYGEKARTGVILIETRGYKKPISKEKINELAKKFKLDTENGSFVIHKRSQKSDFKFYEKYLQQIGVIVKILGVERNAEGFITTIKIKLVDSERNNKMSENWTKAGNPNGIPDILIGRKKGKLVLSAK
jgi:hypothetical protein